MFGHGAFGQFAFGELSDSDAGGDVITPTSIPSDEAFGTPLVSADAYMIYPDSITSEEAFGVPSILVTIVYLPHSRL